MSNKLYEAYVDAVRREKRFKSWCRQWKLNRIADLNPELRDLDEELCLRLRLPMREQDPEIYIK
ncbi:endonuclease [Legionella longbeachae]|nr:endonuclease [Legionella longbeachae]QIN34033.1 endonuclease [Legionella longbeachae]QIN37361.1 endonuclease [Legionella longbeachae]RZV28384.1 endonuclease [Legionella longbeachae]